MNKYPQFIEVVGRKIPINTDFRIALECDEICRDDTIGEYEKCLAIIYKLFGDIALDDRENRETYFKLAIKYLQCGKEFQDLNNDEDPSMDFEQDIGYIRASFLSDYQIDLEKTEIHWWQFNDLMCGLTENSALNRVRFIREEPLNDKKGKDRERWVKAKEQVALKRKKTAKEKELDKLWEKQMKKE